MEPSLPDSEKLPAELYYDVLLEILLENLQQAIINEEPPVWNALVVIPSVSKGFNAISQAISRQIFGESETHPRKRLAHSRALWAKTRISPPPEWDPDREKFDPRHIPRDDSAVNDVSVLAAYDYMSLGLYYFNTNAAHEESEPWLGLFHLWMPYMVNSMRICDRISRRRFLDFVGRHISETMSRTLITDRLKVAHYALTSSMKTATRENYIRESDIQDIRFTLNTLQSVEENQLKYPWASSFVMQAFPIYTTPSPQFLIESDILDALRLVVEYDWDDDANCIKQHATMLYNVFKARIQNSW